MLRAGFSRRLRAGLILLALLAAGNEAVAQCVMCGQAAANAGDPQQAAATFNTAILVLLIPVALLLSAVGLLVWRFRNDSGGGYQRTLEAPVEAPGTP
jgi:hypothetical protein